jgi:hypothetical protein
VRKVQILIDIPERIYKINKKKSLNLLDRDIVQKAIREGISLQKDHGDLIDKGKLLDTLKDLDLEWIRTNCSTDEDGVNIIEDIIEEESIIIEADKTEREV